MPGPSTAGQGADSGGLRGRPETAWHAGRGPPRLCPHPFHAESTPGEQAWARTRGRRGRRELSLLLHRKPDQGPEMTMSQRLTSSRVCSHPRVPPHEAEGQGSEQKAPPQGPRTPNPRLAGLPREGGQKRRVQALRILFHIVLQVGRQFRVLCEGAGRYPRACPGSCLVSLCFKKRRISAGKDRKKN